MSRALVVFPGRGGYGPASLGSLTPGHPWVERADELRRAGGLPTLTELDSADRLAPALHLRPLHAWPLTFLVSLLDAERIADDHEVVAVVASSTGWYSALAASGALDFDDALRLVQEMARAAEEPLPDDASPAELVYPLVDDAWTPDPARSTTLDEAVAAQSRTERALELGSFSVVAGPAEEVEAVARSLPAVTVAGRSYPLRLATADAWHTALRASGATEAVDRVGEMGWRRPNVALVDGRGVRFTPWSTEPAELARASLVSHAEAPYDFARAFRVALREYVPEVVLLPGPGSTLGTPCAQLIVAEGYRGIRSRGELEAVQAGPTPILLSLRR